MIFTRSLVLINFNKWSIFKLTVTFWINCTSIYTLISPLVFVEFDTKGLKTQVCPDARNNPQSVSRGAICIKKQNPKSNKCKRGNKLINWHTSNTVFVYIYCVFNNVYIEWFSNASRIVGSQKQRRTQINYSCNVTLRHLFIPKNTIM